jgi:hypothetical protein
VELDVDEWEALSIYKGGYTAGSQEVRWFWRLVRAMDAEQVRRVPALALALHSLSDYIRLSPLCQLLSTSSAQSLRLSVWISPSLYNLSTDQPSVSVHYNSYC